MNSIQSYNSSCIAGSYYVGNQTPLLGDCHSFLVKHIPNDVKLPEKNLLELTSKGSGFISNIVVAFKAALTEPSSERTGAGNWARLKANELSYQYGPKAYDAETGVFTAPLPGIYKLDCYSTLAGITSRMRAAYTTIFVTSKDQSKSYISDHKNAANIRDHANRISLAASEEIFMKTNDTASCFVAAFQGASNSAFFALDNSNTVWARFSGRLVQQFQND